MLMILEVNLHEMNRNYRQDRN